MVEVQLRSGDVYIGVVHDFMQNKTNEIVLRMAKKKENERFTRPIDKFVISSTEFVQLFAKDVIFDSYHDKGWRFLLLTCIST